jgi:hypothetical protein
MFRFALIAYLSFTTVLRPALCCCTVEQFLPGSECCSGTGSSQADAEHASHKTHKNCHGHAKPQKQTIAEKHTQSDGQSTPCDQDGKNCPCGKRFASMAIKASASFQTTHDEAQVQAWPAHFLILAETPSIDTQHVSLLAQSRQSDRYGREMLRAYQIMRC